MFRTLYFDNFGALHNYKSIVQNVKSKGNLNVCHLVSILVGECGDTDGGAECRVASSFICRPVGSSGPSKSFL